MVEQLDPAYLMFKDDMPASAAPAPVEPVLRSPKLTPSWVDKAPAPAAPVHSSASQTPTDPAEVLFGEEARKPAENTGQDFMTDNSGKFVEVSSVMDRAVIDAFGDGERERGEALKLARDAIIDDALDHGTDKETINEAFAVLREVNSASMVPPSEEELAQSFSAGIETIKAEYGSGWLADLDAARAFIRDLEVKAPGTMASLERFGAGNDPRLIRKVISEARRRGY